MAISPLLNDLALAAATDRTVASRKAAPKSSDASFGSTLSEARKENAVVNAGAKRPPQSRLQTRHDPRDHRSPEASQSHSEKHDLRETKSQDRQKDIRSDEQQNGKKTTTDDGRSPKPVKSDGTDAQIEQSTATNADDAQLSSLKQSPVKETAQTEAAPIEAVALDASTLISSAGSQPIPTTTTPVEAQIAALAAGAKNDGIGEDKNKALESLTDETASAKADEAALKADISVSAAPSAQAQTQAQARTAEQNAPQLEVEAASDKTAEISPASTNIKSIVSAKAEQTEDKAKVANFDASFAQANAAENDRASKAPEHTAFKQAFNEALASTNSNKTGDIVSTLSAVAGGGNAEATQAVRTPVTPPSDGLSRADAPVPLQAVAVEIGMRAMRGSKEFSIRLDPEDLGRIDIRLEISEAGEVQAKMTVDRVETLQLLQRDAKTLERAFDQAGLKSNPDGLQFSLRDPGQQRDGQNNQQSERPRFNGSDKDLIGMEETPVLRSFRYTSPATSGLDIRI